MRQQIDIMRESISKLEKLTGVKIEIININELELVEFWHMVVSVRIIAPAEERYAGKPHGVSGKISQIYDFNH